MIKSNRYNSIAIWLFILIEFFIVINEPCVINRFIPVPGLTVNGVVFFLIILGLYVSDSDKTKKAPKQFMNLAIITSMGWLLFAVVHGDTSYFTRIFFVWLTFFVLSLLYKKGALIKFWYYNNNFILIQTILGLLCLVLVALGLLESLVTAYDLGTVQRPTYFFGLTFSNALFGNIVRPAGVFDEPGALACWAIYSLMINYCFIKEKIVSRYLPIFTFCTISMAYIIQIAVFTVMNNITKIYKIALLAVVVVIGISLLQKSEGSDVDLYYYTLRRFEQSDDKGFEGNNRQEQTENALKMWLENPFFGIGGKKNDELRNSSSYIRISDNPYEVLAKDGAIGFVITYLPLFLVLFSKKGRKKEYLIAILVLSIGYLQRPFHINFVHYLFLWGFYFLFILKNKEGLLDTPSRKIDDLKQQKE